MAISTSYPKGVPIEDTDLFVGTKGNNNRTVNYTAQGVADYLNINAKVSIGGQMSFRFSTVPNLPKTIAFDGGLGDGTAFSAISKLIVSAIDLSSANITIFLNYLNNSQVLLTQQNQPNFFGHYKITGYTQIGLTDFYELDLEYIGGNGTIGEDQYYDLVSFVLTSGSTTTPTLEQVLTVGNESTTQDAIFRLDADKYLKINRAGQTIELWDNIGSWGSPPTVISLEGFTIYDTVYRGSVINVGGIEYSLPTGASSQIATLLDIPSYTVPTLDEVLAAGDTATDKNIILGGTDPFIELSNTDGSLAQHYAGGSSYGSSYINESEVYINGGLPYNQTYLYGGTLQLGSTASITRQYSLYGYAGITFAKGSTEKHIIDYTDPTGDRTHTLQDASGIIAHLSDIPTVTGTIPHATAAGTDTYTATITGVTAYNDADAFLIRFTNGNTTSATLNINGLGARALYRNNDGVLIGGDIISGGEMLCVYNSTNNRFQVIGTAPNSLFAYVTNDDSVTLTKGMPVYAFGGTGDRMTVKRAFNTSDATSAQTVGLVLSTSIAANQKGLIMMQGLLDGLSILPTSTWNDGDPVYLGATAGTITNVKPYAPNHLVYLGVVTTASNGSAGRLYVRVQNGYELDELHNVQARTPSLNDTLWYDNTVSPAQWKTASISTILGYTPGTVTSVAALTLGTSGTDLSSTVANGTTTPVITLNVPTASATNRGVVSSADWSKFNNATLGSFGASFDGMGSVVLVNTRTYFRMQKAGTITEWSIIAEGTSPTATFDVWKIASGTALPTVANTIFGTKPALATGNAITSTTMTGWTTTFAANDMFCINVDACSAATKLQLLFKVTYS